MVLALVQFYSADCFDAEFNRHGLVTGGCATLLNTFGSSACYHGSEFMKSSSPAVVAVMVDLLRLYFSNSDWECSPEADIGE
jgi:hypothetical protein